MIYNILIFFQYQVTEEEEENKDNGLVADSEGMSLDNAGRQYIYAYRDS